MNEDSQAGPTTLVCRYRIGTGPWQEQPVVAAQYLVGRGSDCDLRLESSEISRRHFKIAFTPSEITLTDLGSTNGTTVNGVPALPNRPVPVHPGDLVAFGNCLLALDPRPSASPPAAPVPVPAPAQPASRWYLHYRFARSPWQCLPLPEGELVIGRSPNAGLYLNDGEISRTHCRVVVSPDSLGIMDLGSTNGTQLKGQPVPPRRLFRVEPGELFSIGPYSFYVNASPAEGGYIPGREPTVYAPQAPEAQPGPEIGVQTMLDPEAAGPGLPGFGTPVRLHHLDIKNLERVTIGRAADNHLVIEHPQVSRYHAVLERLGARFHLRDLRSANGVYLNGQRVERETWLKEGDEIRIGPNSFILTSEFLHQQVDTGLPLTAQHLNLYVNKTLNILQDISLSIRPMEFVALVGMSGAGKTTLLNALSGYRPATQGQVRCGGVNLYQNYNLFRNDIGYVPQKDIVHTELTPEEALEYAARLRMPPDTSPDERSLAVHRVLNDLDLAERRSVPIARLSGGQLKRVSIGVELLTRPRLFFLDEPTSGLDPGTEFDMMKLMRRLADQGRTIVLVTHATKNVMFCDKVVFLARGGHLAFFGPPEDALTYFDQHRTDRERREKEMEFDDIYRILQDESRGKPAEWAQRYKQSAVYQQVMGTGELAARPAVPPTASQAGGRSGQRHAGRSNSSALRQLSILSARNLKIIAKDKVSLGLMLAIAPAIGLLDFIWGSRLYDPVKGDAAKILTLWFMAALITVLVGALSSVREIVKEADIYKRERAVNLRVFPYVLSKVWVGVVLALYQSGVLLLTKLVFVRPDVPAPSAYAWLYVTLFLATLCGYLVGLAISASAPNQNAAMMLIIAALVPQFMFAGALLPLDLIPGGRLISNVMPTRWAFEAFVRITGMGAALETDPCWAGTPENLRASLSEAEKQACPCMGPNIFTACTAFPGILSPDFYTEQARQALARPRPAEPPLPTPIPYPTPYPSPTPLPTPTRLPSPTPYPTPADPRDLGVYMDQRQAQGEQYQSQVLDQFEQYRLDSQAQGQEYSDQRTAQGDEYAILREQQGDEYADAMRAYGDDRAAWQESREKAISSAEGLLGNIYDNFTQVFSGEVYTRWLNMAWIMIGLFAFVLFFQSRKDVV